MNTAVASPPNMSVQISATQQAKNLTRAGWWIVGGALAPIGLWMALAPIAMAVVAPGFVRVDLNRRPVQHLEGGIVREVLVRDGQFVKAGDPVLLLGSVSVDADRNRLDYRVLTERAALVRFEAEQRLLTGLVFAPDMLGAAKKDERVRQALDKEASLFKTRRDALNSELALMQTQRQRIEQEITTLRSQISLSKSSFALQQKDLESNRKLQAEGFVAATRITQLEASVADYAARLEENQSELLRAQQRLGDIDLKVKSVQNEFSKAASDQVKVTAARLAEIEQEQRKSSDAATRQMVLASATGEIIDLKFTSPGAVIRPGDTIAEIVPTDAKMLIEARIRPEEISYVRKDLGARVKFTSFKYRNSSMVDGKVTYVSADRLTDPATHQPYYTVIVTADVDKLQKDTDFKIQAGMPSEVYIEGITQTPVQYLMDPVTNTLRRSARQL